jgi:hypothetical protein
MSCCTTAGSAIAPRGANAKLVAAFGPPPSAIWVRMLSHGPPQRPRTGALHVIGPSQACRIRHSHRRRPWGQKRQRFEAPPRS